MELSLFLAKLFGIYLLICPDEPRIRIRASSPRIASLRRSRRSAESRQLRIAESGKVI